MRFRHRDSYFEISGHTEHDHISRLIADTETFYEIDLLEYIRHMASKRCRKGVAIDVGANIGNHSIYLSNFVAHTTIAIEPNPSILATLRKNLASNAGNYLIADCAVGKTRGRGRVVAPPAKEDNIGMAKIEIASDQDSPILISTIDDVVESYLSGQSNFVDVAVIKIDIEGMEIEALAGAANVISVHKPELYVEAQTPGSLKEVASFLQNYGYVPISRWAATPVYHFSASPSLALRLRAIVYKLRWCVLRALRRHLLEKKRTKN